MADVAKWNPEDRVVCDLVEVVASKAKEKDIFLTPEAMANDLVNLFLPSETLYIIITFASLQTWVHRIFFYQFESKMLQHNRLGQIRVSRYLSWGHFCHSFQVWRFSDGPERVGVDLEEGDEAASHSGTSIRVLKTSDVIILQPSRFYSNETFGQPRIVCKSRLYVKYILYG